MQKLMWFLFPWEVTPLAWRRWSDLELATPPPQLARWVRSQGETRTTSFLTPGQSPCERAVALEEIWVRPDQVAAVRAWMLDRRAGLAAHLGGLADVSDGHLVWTDDIRVIDGPRVVGQGRTTLALYVRRPGQSRADSHRHWLHNHAEMVRRHGGMTHYSQCPVLDPDSAFDGVPVIHFSDEASEASFRANAANMAEQLEDSHIFIDHARTLRFSFGAAQHEVALSSSEQLGGGTRRA